MEVNYCLLGMTFILSSVVMCFQRKDSDVFKKFMNLLDETQKQTYNEIIKERIMIYSMGIVLGLTVGTYFYMKHKGTKYAFCKFLAIVYVIKIGFYYLYPKKPLMLYSLTTPEQTKGWADIYMEMKWRWRSSIVVGFFGYVFITKFLDK